MATVGIAQFTGLNLNKQQPDQSGRAYSAMTQLKNLTESLGKIKVLALTANNTEEPLRGVVFN